MARLPTILVAGGGDLYVKLLEPFPPTSCNIAYAESVVEALDLAGDAALVVVDSKLDGGGVDLCRRLRSDPVTSSVPLILRVKNRVDHVQALTDARILESDLPTLVKTMRQLAPELSAPRVPVLPEDAPDENYFDEGPTTVLFRRPEGKAAEWPQPPPTREERQDLLDFAQVWAGYMNSLIEVMEAPAKLSATELERLRSMATLTVDGTEQHLNAAQAAITEALVAKNLERMKALSSAKNSLYDKLQQMRSLLAKLPSGEASAAGIARPTSGPQPLNVPKKSKLTRAAEAKQAAAAAEKAAQKAERSEQRAQRAPVKPAPHRTQAAAPRKQAPRSRLIFLGVALVLVVAAGVVAYLYPGAQPVEPADSNKPPAMKWVKIEQTVAGVVARAEAEDSEHDAIVFQFRWLVNGGEVEGERTARLAPLFYKEGETVQVEVTPSDGRHPGAPMVSAALIIRAAPPRTAPPPPPAPPAPAVGR